MTIISNIKSRIEKIQNSRAYEAAQWQWMKAFPWAALAALTVPLAFYSSLWQIGYVTAGEAVPLWLSIPVTLLVALAGVSSCLVLVFLFRMPLAAISSLLRSEKP